MAASQTDNSRSVIFTELICQLQSLYSRCEQHKNYYDELCRRYKTVLSPWHLPKQKDSVSEKDLSAKKETNAPEETNTSKEISEVLDHREAEKLLMADKALAKAQRVRTFHEKRAATLENISLIKPTNTSSSTSCDAEKTIPFILSNQESCKDVLATSRTYDEETANPTAMNNLTTETAVIAQSQLDKLMQSTRSANSNKSLPKSKSVSVSAKAPYKTDSVVSRRSSATSKNRTEVVSRNSHSKRPGSATSVTSQGNPRVKSAGKTGSKSAVPLKKAEEVVLHNLNGLTDRSKSVMTQEQINTSLHCRSNDLTKHLEDMNLRDSCKVHEHVCDHEEQTNAQPDSASEAEQFDIKKHGSQTPIPPQLKQVVLKNFKLRKKLRTYKINKKVKDKAPPKEVFLKKLYHHYKKYEDPQFISTMHLTAVYAHLKKLLDGLNELRLEEESPWEDVLRYKQVLEYVFSSFVSLENQYSSLIQGHEVDLPCQNNVKLQRPSSSRPELWLPEIPTGQKGLSQRKWLKYPNKKAKLRYYDLLHQYQTLQLYKQIMETVAEEALPLLQTQDVFDSEMRQLYRSTYSLLVTLGRGFPTLIADVGDSDSEEDMLDF